MISLIYDITMTIQEGMQTYKRNPKNQPIFVTNASHDTTSVHDTSVTLNLHTGTHIDYPLHMIKNGDTSNSENLNTLIGSATLYDLSHCEDHIGLNDIKDLDIKENDFVLFFTKNSLTEDFLDDFIYVDEAASKFLLDKNVRGVGIDSLGIERAQSQHPTHKNLLGNGIVILEGLRLKDVPEGHYTLYALPLKIANVEASHVRAILIDEK
jgi:arylformamidase